MTLTRLPKFARLLFAARFRLRRGLLHPRWRRVLAVPLAVWVLTAPLPDGDTVGTVATSLAHEWSDCAVHGMPAQPGWRVAETTTGELEPDTSPPALDVDGLPVVVPRQHVPAVLPAQEPHPDRPDSLPRSVRVAVIDSGVQADHPEVEGVLPGLDLLNPCGDGRQDITGHGTMVAGVMSSVSYGASPRVEVLPVRVSLDTGRHLPWLSAAAVVYATNQGADIINMSYANQSRFPSMVERAAIRYASSRGVALVASAGNDPHRYAGYPAAYPETLSVTSLDSDGHLSLFAAHKGRVDVAAPGSRVLTLWPDGSVKVASGTSLAAPVVSASIAQLLLTDPSLSGADAVELLRGSSTEPTWPDPNPSLRILDVAGALTSLCQTIGGCQGDHEGSAGGGGGGVLPR